MVIVCELLVMVIRRVSPWGLAVKSLVLVHPELPFLSWHPHATWGCLCLSGLAIHTLLVRRALGLYC